MNETPEDRKKRFLEASEALRRAFALSVPHEDALAIRDELRYMQALRANLLKVGPSGGKPTEYDMDTAIAQWPLVNRAGLSRFRFHDLVPFHPLAAHIAYALLLGRWLNLPYVLTRTCFCLLSENIPGD